MEKSLTKIQLKTLKDFKSTLRSFKIFNDAISKLPEFFDENLVDDARTIKILQNDSLAYIKIFYFQFLKLCFQTEDVDYDTKINKFIDTVERNTNLLSLSSKYSSKQLSSQNIKNLLFEFLEIISECKQPVETTLSTYPVIGQIFTNFFINYLKKYHKIQKQFNTFQTVKKLSQQFQVQILEYDNCIQFTDSQVYVYKEKQQEIYMIYIDQSKVERNLCTNSGGFSNATSNKSLQNQNYQVIAFQAPDIIFDETGMSGFMTKNKLCNQDLATRQTFTKSVPKQVQQTKTKQFQKRISHNKQNIQIFNPITQKQKTKTELATIIKEIDINNPPHNHLDVTKQFTSTFILDNIILEPYRAKIKQLKAKARAERKSKKPLYV